MWPGGPYGGLRLGCIDPIDRTWVKSEVTQMHLRHLDVSSIEEPIHSGAFSPGVAFPCVGRDAGGEQHPREPSDNTPRCSHTMPPRCDRSAS
jgi:hypothetical protein